MSAAEYATQLAGRALTDDEVADCIRIIEKGAAVDVESAREELPHAMAVALTRLNGEIVGVGVIKCVRTGYAKKIARRAKFEFPASTLELGYVAVDPPQRGNGLSHALVAALLATRGDMLFATTSSGQMKRVLLKAGFVLQGEEWEGNSSQLTLWLRPADKI